MSGDKTKKRLKSADVGMFHYCGLNLSVYLSIRYIADNAPLFFSPVRAAVMAEVSQAPDSNREFLSWLWLQAV